MCFFNLGEKIYLEQNVFFSPLKALICRQFTSHKQTLFSQGNNVIDVLASKVDGFLSRYTCVLFNSAE
jgi:hypothetical protein